MEIVSKDSPVEMIISAMILHPENMSNTLNQKSSQA
jgi:hypothetical protein